jgi:hypothetical protein
MPPGLVLASTLAPLIVDVQKRLADLRGYIVSDYYPH